MANPSTDSLLTALKKIHLFSALSEALLDRLVPFAGLRTIRRGESIFLQGELSPYCFGVLKGRVEIYRVSRDRKGPTKRLGEFGAGEFFGESSLFLETPRTATATACEDGELLTLTGAKLREWVHALPAHSVPIMMNLLEHSLDRLHYTSQELALVYGMDRILGSDQPFEQRLSDALAFLEQAFPGVDGVQLYERSIAWEEFTGVSFKEGSRVDPLPLDHPFLIRMKETDQAALLTPTELDAWKMKNHVGKEKITMAMAVSLWDRDQTPRTLEGFLIVTAMDPLAHFSHEHLQLLSAVASPISEALLRHRRQQDADARERLNRSRDTYPK